MSAELADYRWLVSEEASGWLEKVAGQAASVQLAASLRRDLSADRAALILQQAELRQKARSKFPLAERMFFLLTALEQATDFATARYKAAQLSASGIAADRPVVDLCCGIGGDLIAWAKDRVAVAVDRDPIHLLFAEANCNAVGLPQQPADVLRFVAANAEDFALANRNVRDRPFDAVFHIDPDRRASGKRGTRLEDHSPNREALEQIIDAVSDVDTVKDVAAVRDVAIKLAPATSVPDQWQQRCRLEWIGTTRECRQQVAWFGAFAPEPNIRCATAIGDQPQKFETIESRDASESLHALHRVGELSRFLVEPAPAVLAADLCDELSARFDLTPLSGSAYLTSDAPAATRLAASFEIIEAMPFNERRIKEWLKAHNVGTLEIKKRGIAFDPRELQAKLKSACRGDDRLTLFVFPLAAKNVAVFARRIVNEPRNAHTDAS